MSVWVFVFPSFEVPWCKYKHKYTHTPCMHTYTHSTSLCSSLQGRVSLELQTQRPGQLILKLQKASIRLPLQCSDSNTRRCYRPMSKAPLISELPNLKARTNSRQPSSSVLQFLCTFDVTHDLFELSNGLYCFSHRHLRLDAVVFALLRGVNLSATSGYARHILPFHCTSIIPASYTRPRLLLL